jgi:hypothetical protein
MSTLNLGVRSQETNYFGPNEYSPGADFAEAIPPQMYQLNPITGAAWTVDDVNNVEIGVKLEIED